MTMPFPFDAVNRENGAKNQVSSRNLVFGLPQNVGSGTYIKYANCLKPECSRKSSSIFRKSTFKPATNIYWRIFSGLPIAMPSIKRFPTLPSRPIRSRLTKSLQDSVRRRGPQCRISPTTDGRPFQKAFENVSR